MKSFDCYQESNIWLYNYIIPCNSILRLSRKYFSPSHSQLLIFCLVLIMFLIWSLGSLLQSDDRSDQNGLPWSHLGVREIMIFVVATGVASTMNVCDQNCHVSECWLYLWDFKCMFLFMQKCSVEIKLKTLILILFCADLCVYMCMLACVCVCLLCVRREIHSGLWNQIWLTHSNNTDLIKLMSKQMYAHCIAPLYMYTGTLFNNTVL